MPFRAFTQLLPITFVGASVIPESSDQVSALAKLMSEYGTEVVIIAIFITIFVTFCCVFLKMLNRLIENVIQQNQQMMNLALGKTPAGDEKKEEFKKKEKDSSKEKNTTDIISNNVYINKIFNEVSKNVIGELRCDRVGIYVFHNGNKTPYGYSFVKMTCIFEQTMRGNCSTNRGMNHQGVPLHVFTNIVDCLIRNGEYIVGNVYNHGIISADEQILNFISGSRTKALFALAIKDSSNEVAGFVVAEFDNEQDFSSTKNYNIARNALKHMSDTIHPIIIDNDFRSKYENNKEAH